MNEKVEYTITVDWRYDFELLYAVQRSLDTLMMHARYLKSHHCTISTELAIIKELISIKRQIKAHDKLTWVKDKTIKE